MSERPKVTVLMPVYNGERYLREAIESILVQTFADFEFLIINDGSTDRSVDVIESFRDSRIRLIHNGKNSGLIKSLNMGIELARGMYIARMDSDDKSIPSRLMQQVEFMDRHPDIGICGTWVRFFPQVHDYKWKLPADHEKIVCQLFFNTALAHPSVMMRRDVLIRNKLYYDPLFKHTEDFEYWVRAAGCTRLANIPKVMLYYRISESQICQVHNAEQQEAAARIRKAQLTRLDLHPDKLERQIHEALAKGEFIGSKEYVSSAEAWLIKISEANIRQGVYPEPFFSERIADIWLQICAVAAQSDNCSFAQMWNSALFKKSRTGYSYKTLSIIRWIAAVWGAGRL